MPDIVEIYGPRMAWLQVVGDDHRQMVYHKVQYAGKDAVDLASRLANSIAEMKRLLIMEAAIVPVIIWRKNPSMIAVTNEEKFPVSFIASFRAATIPELSEANWEDISGGRGNR